jgi:hypothetical protein
MNYFGLFLLLISSGLTYYSINSGYGAASIASQPNRAPASTISKQPSLMHVSHTPKKVAAHHVHA